MFSGKDLIKLYRAIVITMEKEPLYNLHNNQPPLVIGHRGVAGYAPENTIASIKKAYELKIRWVELDVKLSRDGIPILFHDNRLERTANGCGEIAHQDLLNLQDLDAGSWFKPEYKHTTIPTLRCALSALKFYEIGANLELKPSPGEERKTGTIVGKLLTRAWPSELPPPIISSFSSLALQAYAAEAPSAQNALLNLAVPRNWRMQLDRLNIRSLHCQSQRLRQNRAKDILNNGYTLRCFTVNRADRAMQLLNWGVHGIISDYPDRITKRLSKNYIDAPS